MTDSSDDNDPIDHLLDRLGPDAPAPTADAATGSFLANYQYLARATQSLRTAVREAAGMLDDTASLPPTIPGYDILGELGDGGFGVVYVARQLALNRLVAIKILRPREEKPDSMLLERFDRERRALAQLNHPNILGVIDAGEVEGQPYLILEYAQGGDLTRYIRSTPDSSPWPIPVVVKLVETLARAVHAAHKAGIVHRDLKPANVMVSLPEGAAAIPLEGGLPPGAVLKVADFGLVRLLGGFDDSDTVSYTGPTPNNVILGTPSYMAPEQATGKGSEAGPAADVWSLGVILYELLTGRRPFTANSSYEIIKAVETHEPLGPRAIRAEIPVEVEAVCLRALRKNPADRFPSAADFANTLAAALDGIAPPLTPRADAPIASKPRRWAVVAGSAIAAIALIGAVVYLLPSVLDDGGAARTSPDLSSHNPPEVHPGTTHSAPRTPLPTEQVIRLIRLDLEAHPAPRQGGEPVRHYLFAPHLAPGSSLTEAERSAYRTALGALSSHLRPGGSPLFRPLDPDRTVFALDLPAGSSVPSSVLIGYPYGLRFDQSHVLRREDAFIRQTTGPVAFVRADWFVRVACDRMAIGESVFGVRGAPPQSVRDWSAEWNKRPVDLATVVDELGTDADQVRLAIRTQPPLMEAFKLGPLTTGQTVSRSVWESQEFAVSAFQELARELNAGTPILAE